MSAPGANSDDATHPTGAPSEQPTSEQPPVPSESQADPAAPETAEDTKAEAATSAQGPTTTPAAATSSNNGPVNQLTVNPSFLTTSRVLDPFSLSPHTNIGNDSSTVSAATLAAELLGTGNHFVNSVLTTFKFDTKSKRLPPTNDEILISRGKHNDETWVARSSTHRNQASNSSATLEEFERGLKDDHSKNEAEYTHLADSVEIASWDLSQDNIEGWNAVTMEGASTIPTFQVEPHAIC
jgi:hypothetical protein